MNGHNLHTRLARLAWPVLLAFLSFAAALNGGCNSGPVVSADTSAVSHVKIADVRHLSPPVVGTHRSYKIDQWMPLADDRVAVTFFTLDIATTAPHSVKVQLVDQASGVTTPLVSIPEADGFGDLDLDNHDPLLTDDMTDLLQKGYSLFWHVDGLNDSSLMHRYGFAVCEDALGEVSTLHAFVSETAAGSPLAGDTIEIVKGFFYMAAIGDSAMWGNGLRDEDKFSTLVAQTIERETGLKVIRQVLAVSGASIVPADDDHVCTYRCSGEVPTAWTSITLQAQSIEHPEAMNLILMDGCGNDVTLAKILSPLTKEEDLIERTERFCGEEMTNLLVLVRSLAPQTPIVVTGYFPFISMDSGTQGAGQVASTQNIPVGEDDITEDILEGMSASSETFHGKSSEQLQLAVASAAELTGFQAPMVFVDAGFGPENATAASEAWLWGLTVGEALQKQLNLDITVIPEDPLLEFRLEDCIKPGVQPDVLTCVYGSVAHPNVAGARAYADAIVDELRRINLLEEEPQP